MFHSIEEATKWLNDRLTFGIKPGLQRMEWLMDRLGHPERRIKTVHIAGTNGKGSTVSFIRSILQEQGYKVGTFTSPYVHQFNERISINTEPISDEDFIKVLHILKPLSEELENTPLGPPTEFEILTAAAIYYFAVIECPDLVIFETGLGGRLDSTNIILPLLTIITSIGFDHMNILGETIEAITFEKAGIIKSGVPIIFGVQQKESVEIIGEVALSKKAKLYQLGADFHVESRQFAKNEETFTFSSPFGKRENLSISMLGEHQVRNCSLALMAVEYLVKYFSFIVDENAIYNGLKKMKWIGRFEQLSSNPTVIIDGAHNPEGIETLVKTIEEHFKGYYVRVVFSALKDKEIHDMVNQFNQPAFRITFTSFDYPRAASAKELFEESRFTNKHFREDWKQAIEEEIEQMKENEVLVVTGSLYFISVVRKYLLAQKNSGKC